MDIMSNAIENMMNEHQLIVKVLASLDALSQKLQSGQTVPRAELGRFTEFFREFADHSHHGKEEDFLFARMNENGFPREYGPVGVMLSEHDAGRTHVRALTLLSRASGTLSPKEIQEAILHINEFVPLLLMHIQKENNILYPMAQQALSPATMAALDQACDAFDREPAQAIKKSQLTKLADQLINDYPANPERLMAANSHCGGPNHACSAY
jgi:hemerythrin-like domain-containing protein